MQVLFNVFLASVGMFWQVFWSLVLGFILSAYAQTYISKEKFEKFLGKEGPKEIALASILGAISSSCSYAAASMSKTFFKKGASLISSLAFLFSSTNLVVELGLILWVLLGWQFTLAEWLGGILLIVTMSLLIKLTYPKKLVNEARFHLSGLEHEHDHSFQEKSLKALSQSFVMDINMLKKDLILGFLISGIVAVVVPNSLWSLLFFKSSPLLTQQITGALIGPLIAVVTFVCSIGNVPLAAILYFQGLSFSGVLAFLYADLIVIPLLNIYRKYYGIKMAAYIGVIFYLTMALSGLIMGEIFNLLNLIPKPPIALISQSPFSLNYTSVLNVIFGLAAIYLIWLSGRNARHT